jgi:hypothetical protein
VTHARTHARTHTQTDTHTQRDTHRHTHRHTHTQGEKASFSALKEGRYTARWNRHLQRHRGALHAIQVGSTASQAGENVRPNEYERPNEYR